MNHPTEYNRHFLKWTRLSWLGIALSIAALFFGMMATGGGHGTYTLWYCGLILSAVSWLLVLVSIVSGFKGMKETKETEIWLPALVFQCFVFLCLTCAGLWGMGG